MINSQKTLRYGTRTIAYRVRFSTRKTLAIAVHADSQIVVTAPKNTGTDIIHTKVMKRIGWIARQLDFFESFGPKTPPRCYIGGETHLYLGRQYRLKILTGTADAVKLSQGFFFVTVHGHATPRQVKRVLESWYYRQAIKKYSELIDKVVAAHPRLFSAKPKLMIKAMKTRWGSLSEKGTMTLHQNLVKAPKECVEYVIVHELCHAIHRKHDNAFYKLLTKLLPDWKRRKEKLEQVMA